MERFKLKMKSLYGEKYKFISCKGFNLDRNEVVENFIPMEDIKINVLTDDEHLAIGGEIQLDLPYLSMFRESKANQFSISGTMGAGKTTLCQKIAYDWAVGKNTHHKLVIVMEATDLVSHEADIILATFKKVCPELSREECALLWKNEDFGGGCLFVIDNIDVLLETSESEVKLAADNLKYLQKHSGLQILLTARCDLDEVSHTFLDFSLYHQFSLSELTRQGVHYLASLFFNAYNNHWKNSPIQVIKAANTIVDCITTTDIQLRPTPFSCSTMCWLYCLYFQFESNQDGADHDPDKGFHYAFPRLLESFYSNEDYIPKVENTEAATIEKILNSKNRSGMYKQYFDNEVPQEPEKIEQLSVQDLRKLCRKLRSKIKGEKAIHGYYPNKHSRRITMDIKKGSRQKVQSYLQRTCPEIWAREIIDFMEQPESPEFVVNPWTSIASLPDSLGSSQSRCTRFEDINPRVSFGTITSISKPVEPKGNMDDMFITTAQHVLNCNPGTYVEETGHFYTEGGSEGLVEISDKYYGVLGGHTPVYSSSSSSDDEPEFNAVDIAVLPIKKPVWKYLCDNYEVLPSSLHIYQGDYDDLEKTEVQLAGTMTPTNKGIVDNTDYYATLGDSIYDGVIVVLPSGKVSSHFATFGDSGSIVRQCKANRSAIGIVSKIHRKYKSANGNESDATLVFRLGDCYDALNKIQGIPIQMSSKEINGFFIGSKKS